MITEEAYRNEEQKFNNLLQQAGWSELPPVDNARIDRIVERAHFENIAKESTSFIFSSFSTVITSFMATAFGSVPKNDHPDYRA